MDYLCFVIMGFIPFIAASVLFTAAILRKRKRRRVKMKDEHAFNGIGLGISERLHADYPGSKWRWVCRPADYAVNGGIGRIDVLDQHGKRFFMDVCYSAGGYMALHVLNVVELTASEPSASLVGSVSPVNDSELPFPTGATTGAKPIDEESVATWYNIVLIDALTSLIDDLHAKGEVCLYIGQDGKAFVEENGSNTIICAFGDMPDMALWSHITERLAGAGLFAEVQEGNCIFISWA